MSEIQGSGMTSQRTRFRMVERLRAQGIRDETVLSAIAATPRHIFVEEALAHRAYEDTALPLGFGQTISQPYVVARMIELLRFGRDGIGKTLEIGAGCGYQASVLARMTSEVFAIERVKPLIEKAKSNFRQTRQFNIRLKYADGHEGLSEAAPFDTIVCAAATSRIPPALLQQLSVGGRMILPFGASEQVMMLIERTAGGYTETRYESVRFVPMLPGTV